MPRWVTAMVGALQTAPIAAGCVTSSRSNWLILGHNLAQFHPFFPGRSSGSVDFIAGANMGFRREIFRNLCPFRDDCLIPDMEFILRARQKKYPIIFAPEAVVIHAPARSSLRKVLHYGAAHAFHSIRLRLKYQQLLQTPLFLKVPVLLFSMAPMIAGMKTAQIYLSNRQLKPFLPLAPLVFLIKLAWCWGAAQGLSTSVRSSFHALNVE